MYFLECQVFSKCRDSQEHGVSGIKDSLKAGAMSKEKRNSKKQKKEKMKA